MPGTDGPGAGRRPTLAPMSRLAALLAVVAAVLGASPATALATPPTDRHRR